MHSHPTSWSFSTMKATLAALAIVLPMQAAALGGHLFGDEEDGEVAVDQDWYRIESDDGSFLLAIWGDGPYLAGYDGVEELGDEESRAAQETIVEGDAILAGVLGSVSNGSPCPPVPLIEWDLVANGAPCPPVPLLALDLVSNGTPLPPIPSLEDLVSNGAPLPPIPSLEDLVSGTVPLPPIPNLEFAGDEIEIYGALYLIVE